MTYRTRNILIAVALAVMAALLTSLYVSNYKRNVRNSEASVTVWVAKADIPANTAGVDLVTKHLLVKQDVARRNVVPGAISDPTQVANQIVVQPVYQGEQVSARRFGTKSEIGVRSQLKGTLRAVEIPGTTQQLLAGTLRAGDHVDLVADIPWGEDRHLARTAVRDLLVLKAPEVTAAGKLTEGANGNASVMLAVRDLVLSKVQWVVAPGRDNQWTLALRAPVKAADSPNNIDTLQTVVADGVSQAELNRAKVTLDDKLGVVR